MAGTKKPRKAPATRKAKRTQGAEPKPRTLTPYLAVGNAAEAIEWYKRALGAREVSRNLEPTGKVMHATLKVGDSLVYLSDIFPGSDMKDPRDSGPSVNLHIYSRDINRIFETAVSSGARVTMPLADQFWGDRYGRLQDPFGHSWAFSYPAKMTEAQKEKMREEAMKAMSGGERPGA